MKVQLIDYTGAGHPDPLYAARLLIFAKSTRLEQTASTRAMIDAMSPEEVEQELYHISRTIKTSWEFVDYTFSISGVTRAFTHQLVRTRTASYAQQSQRTVHMARFNHVVPADVAADAGKLGLWYKVINGIQEGYDKLTEMGVPTQDARGLLPTNVCTAILMKANLRTLADLIGKRQNLRAQGEYADVAAQIAETVLDIHPWAHNFIYPAAKQTPALDAFFREALKGRTPASVPEINDALKEIDMLKETW